MASTVSLAELREADAASFGGKSASLAELLAAGIPVPPGFAIRCDAELSDDLRAEIASRYGELGDEPPVAVRSSATAEDSAETTFAGLQDTFLWVRGVGAIFDAVRRCRESLYSERAVSYRARLGVDERGDAMGVAVQLMVEAAVAGVMFTCNPVSGDPSMVSINASWGLGPAVVGGEVTPDDYLVSKVTGEVVRSQVGNKDLQYVPGESGAVRVEVPAARRDVRCLDDEALAKLVEVARRVERHFGCHQDIEWALDADGSVFVVQSRPVTVVRERPEKPQPASALSMVMRTFGVDVSE
jgi:pyruvate,water dikinase